MKRAIFDDQDRLIGFKAINLAAVIERAAKAKARRGKLKND